MTIHIKMIPALAMLALAVFSPVAGYAAEPAHTVEVSFDYTKSKGIASNQFAVWIENDAGNIIKTLYVTRFTAKRGWKNRPDALPTWVAQTSADTAPLDAASGATPKPGKLTYIWDFTDAAGNRVPDGTYTVKLEATLFWENRLLATAVIHPETGNGALPVTIDTPPANAKHCKNNDMIRNVTVTLSR